ELGLPVVERWQHRKAVWVLAGSTRIGLWEPQVGLEGSRGGAHVHFAMRVGEHHFDSLVERLRGRGLDVPVHEFGGLGGVGPPRNPINADSSALAPTATGRCRWSESELRPSGLTSAITPALRAAKCTIVPAMLASARSPRPRREGTTDRATSSPSTPAATTVLPSRVPETSRCDTTRRSPSPSTSPPSVRSASPP